MYLSSRKYSFGFTLIEVMIAIAIFALAGVALLSTANTNTNTTVRIEENMLASWVASNQLVAAKLEKKWPPKDKQKGEVELAGRTWYWQQVVKQTTDNSLKAIVIEVRAKENDDSPITQLMTYVSEDS